MVWRDHSELSLDKPRSEAQKGDPELQEKSGCVTYHIVGNQGSFVGYYALNPQYGQEALEFRDSLAVSVSLSPSSGEL